jgi:hypothetical protein
LDENMTSCSSSVQFSFCEEGRNQVAQRLFTTLASKYDYLSSGLYRAVFKMRGDRVLKIPLNEAGEFCNDGEGSIIHDTCARGKWLEIDGFVCVMQEYVEDASLSAIKARFGRIPDWVAGVDSAQVGFTRSGQLKAYDFVHP